MKEYQVYLERARSRQHDFLYPLIFREYIYGLAYSHASNYILSFRHFLYKYNKMISSWYLIIVSN